MRRMVLTLITIMLLNIQSAFALTVFDPSNYAQNLLIATRELQSIEQRIQQLANEAQMLLNMEKNLQSLGSSLAQPLKAKLDELRSLLDKAKGLALQVEEVEEQYSKLFPEDYKKALSMDDTLSQAKARWDERLNAFKTAFGVQTKVLESVKQDGAHLNDLMQKSQNAVGTKSAIQAGNELLALNVKQLLQLQTLLAAQGRGQTLEQAERASNQAASRAYFQNFIGEWRQK